MDTPPSLPPVWPPPLAEPKKFGRSRYFIAAIAGGIVLLVLVGIAAAAPLVFASQAKSARPASPLTAAGKEKLLKFGAKFVEAVNTGDIAFLRQITDAETVTDRCLAGTNAPAGMKEELVDSLVRSPGGLMKSVIGGKVRMLRVIEREGCPAITLRVQTPARYIDYVDVLVQPEEDSFKLIDTYAYTFGTLYSANAQDGTLLLIQGADPGAVPTPPGLNKSTKQRAPRYIDLMSKIYKEDFKGAVAVFEALPPEIRHRRPSFVNYMTALAYLGERDKNYEERYQKALESAREILGPHAMPDMLLYFFYLARKNYKGAGQCIDKMQAVIGEDACLCCLRGIAAISDQDLPLALQCLAAGEKLEPNLTVLVELRMRILAVKGNYLGVVAELSCYTKALGITTVPASLFDAPVYDSFRKSPEFAEWKSRAGKPLDRQRRQ